MSKTESKIKAILALPYARCLLPDPGGGYTATIKEFPGCAAEGDSAEEALRNLDDAAASWIAVALAHDYPIAKPVEQSEYSGKIALRIPRRLHQDAAELALLDDCSTNQLLAVAIAEYIGRRRGIPSSGIEKSAASAAHQPLADDITMK